MKAKDLALLVLTLGVLLLGMYVRTTQTQTLGSEPAATSTQVPTLGLAATSTFTITPLLTVEPAPPKAETGGAVSAVGRGIPLPDSCLVDSEGSAFFVNPVDGYCLRYPARFRVGDVYPPGIANLYGPPHDQTLEPVVAASTIRVMEPALDSGLADTVDWWLQYQGVQPVTRREDGLLGGKPAEIVEGQAERSGVRAVLALHEDKLYALTFYPVDERFPQAAPDVEELWETVVGSFAFLPLEARAALHETADPNADPTPTLLAPAVPESAQTLEPSRLSFESTTYRDELAGFEFDHPRSWTLGHQEKQGRGYIVQLCEQSPDQPRMQITVMLWEPNDLDGFSSRHEQSWLDSGNAIVSREEWMLAGNHRAIRYLIEGRSGERDFVLLTTVGERYLLLSGSGDLNLLAEIARTVRFLDPTAKGADEHPKETGMSADLVQAREALQAYFDLLHDGRYAEAVSYYGGDYEVLKEWNPPVDRNDHATLFKSGCEVNGLQCLAIKVIDSEQEISAGEYRFTIEFVADDGGTFAREPSVERFDYTVKKADGQFLVQELPVYVP